MNDPQEHKDEISAQIDKIVNDPLFRGAKRSCSFLRYVSTRVLNGESYKIKEFSIAVDAFGLETTFDQQIDPRIRVEAKRLRDRLNQYYKGPGCHDQVLVEIPKGSYVPEFRFNRESVGHAENTGSEDAAEPLTILVDGRFSVDVRFSVSGSLEGKSFVQSYQSQLTRSLFDNGVNAFGALSLTDMINLQHKALPVVLEIHMRKENAQLAVEFRIKMKHSGMLIMDTQETMAEREITTGGISRDIAEQHVAGLLDYFRSLK